MAFRAALDGQPWDRAPLDWAAAQYNLGNALVRLGEQVAGTTHFTEAIAAYQAAMEEQTRERMPLDWAVTAGNQGIALMLLAERTGDAARARLAVQQIETALMITQDHGQADLAADYNSQLSKARSLLRRLILR